MTADLDIQVTTGKLRAIPVAQTTGNSLVLNGPCKLCGFSFRDVTGETAAENTGSVTSPAAGANIVSITGLAAGTYDVVWIVALQGAAAAGDTNNFRLVVGGTTIEGSINPGAAGIYAQVNARVTVPVTAGVFVQATLIGTVGVTYLAQIEVIPVLITLSIASLQDGNNDLGEISTVNGGTYTEWFDSQGIEVYNQIRFNVIAGAITGVVYVRFDQAGS